MNDLTGAEDLTQSKAYDERHYARVGARALNKEVRQRKERALQRPLT